MNWRKQLIFWSSSFIILTLLFSSSLGGIVLSLYFVSFLFPIVLGTAFVFNRLLVGRFLLQCKNWKFALYFFYLLVVSVYLEMLVMVLAFVILADFNIENLGSIASNIYLLAIILYLFVFANGFVEIFNGFQRKALALNAMEEERQREQKSYLMIRSNRKNLNLEVDHILLVESLADYVQVHTSEDKFITKQRISELERNLPERFIRIHRSYLVNADRVQSFNRESVVIGGLELNYGRKYKSSALDYLEALATS